MHSNSFEKSPPAPVTIVELGQQNTKSPFRCHKWILMFSFCLCKLKIRLSFWNILYKHSKTMLMPFFLNVNIKVFIIFLRLKSQQQNIILILPHHSTESRKSNELGNNLLNTFYKALLTLLLFIFRKMRRKVVKTMMMTASLFLMATFQTMKAL